MLGLNSSIETVSYSLSNTLLSYAAAHQLILCISQASNLLLG